MRGRWLQLLREALPTFQAEAHTHQLRTNPSSNRPAWGAGAWEDLSYLTDLDDYVTEEALALELADANHVTEAELGAELDSYVRRDQVTQFMQYATYGPFYADDIAGTATEAFQAGFFDGATTLSRSTMDVLLPTDGEVVGASLISNANRTAGTATVQILISGVVTAFDSGASCLLDGTNTRRHAVAVAGGGGVPFVANNRLGAQVVTSGWTPTGCDFALWLTVRYDFPVPVIG